jgi:glycosyltransferase involved in cell wall biosynthesis
MKHSVLLLSRYERKGPSSRVRHYNYIPALEQAGFQVTSAPFLDQEYLDAFFSGHRRSLRLLAKAYLRRLPQVLSASRHDLIWIEKEALPWLPSAVERTLFRGRPIVVDFDDAWYLRYAEHRNPIVRALLGRKFESVISHAVAVTTGSSALTEWARPHARVVVELPPAVDVARYPVLPLPEGPFTVGWIGTPRNEPYVEVVAEPLRRLHRDYGARLRLIGGSGRFSIEGVPVDQIPWSEATEARELAACHVGVMPLLDGPWERGKCGYKLIQYMAAGRATVASPVGAGSSIVVPGETGFLANGIEEWTTALRKLASDRDHARKLGLAGRARAEEAYSLQALAPKLIEVFRRAVSAPTLIDSGP